MKKEAGKYLIKCREIYRHIAENGEAFPLPDNFEYAGDEYGSIWFELSHHCTISKNELAKQLGVEKSQISRWLKAGAPEFEEDAGRIRWWLFESWLRDSRPHWWVSFRRKIFGGKVKYQGTMDIGYVDMGGNWRVPVTYVAREVEEVEESNEQ
jgi:hypothetical protein